MESIGIFDAKTRFSEVVELVNSTGQTITVTNRGKPVVDITPTRAEARGGMTREEAFDAIAALWKETPPAEEGEIQEILQEGRDRWPDM